MSFLIVRRRSCGQIVVELRKRLALQAHVVFIFVSVCDISRVEFHEVFGFSGRSSPWASHCLREELKQLIVLKSGNMSPTSPYFCKISFILSSSFRHCTSENFVSCRVACVTSVYLFGLGDSCVLRYSISKLDTCSTWKPERTFH